MVGPGDLGPLFEEDLEPLQPERPDRVEIARAAPPVGRARPAGRGAGLLLA